MTKLGKPSTSQSLTWDGADRLISWSSLGNAKYDGFGLRAVRTSGSTIYSLYDGDTPVCALDSSGNVLATYTMVPTCMTDFNAPSYGTRMNIYDPRGNAAETVSSAGTVLSSLASVDAFGQSSGGAFLFDTQHTFPTNQAGSGPNSLALGFREYDTTTGRFLKRDPMGYGGGINLYAYTQNNPVNRNDPMGLQSPDNNDSMAVIGDNIDHTTLSDAWDDFQNTGLYKSLAVWANVATAIPDNPVSDVRDVGLLIDLLKQGCFIAGTPVQMADGSTKPIEKVQKGDLVLSRDPQTGQFDAKTVTATSVHSQAGTVALTFSNGDRITSTPEHPYFVAGVGFAPASQLGIGTSIVTRAGPVTQVTGVAFHSATVSVYNFTVADDHTYFVGTHDGGEWVHNDCGDIALGVRESLDAFAENVNAVPWKQWSEAGITSRRVRSLGGNHIVRFGRAFHQACSRASRIHFNLDGIGDIWDAFALGKRGFNKNGGMTNAELHYILSNRAIFDKTLFYRNGRIVHVFWPGD